VHKESIVAKDMVRILDTVKKFPKIIKAIISSVSSIQVEEIKTLLKNIKVIPLTVKTAFPFTIDYATPKTLGVDRIALVAAAHNKYLKQNCLVIDAGSCITYDLIDKNEVYQGGIIGPGLQMRYRSLHDFTARLPLLTPKNEVSIVGKSTNSAMHNGVYTAMAIEINGIIDEFSNTYKDLIVILTGGDAHFLSKRVKNGIFAHSNFLIQGLNYILEYNTDK